MYRWSRRQVSNPLWAEARLFTKEVPSRSSHGGTANTRNRTWGIPLTKGAVYHWPISAKMTG